MPLGSSSAAPVVRPGPRACHNRRNGFFLSGIPKPPNMEPQRQTKAVALLLFPTSTHAKRGGGWPPKAAGWGLSTHELFNLHTKAQRIPLEDPPHPSRVPRDSPPRAFARWRESLRRIEDV